MVAILRRTGLDVTMLGEVGLCSAEAGGLLITYKGADTETVDILLGDGERDPRKIGARSSALKGGVCLGGGEFKSRLGEQIDLCLRIILCCLEV